MVRGIHLEGEPRLLRSSFEIRVLLTFGGSRLPFQGYDTGSGDNFLIEPSGDRMGHA